jgi:predicted TPR repeat methyltransferase
MHDHAARFDVIVSADTLVYFGDLDRRRRRRRGARPEWAFVFTLEHAVEAAADPTGGAAAIVCPRLRGAGAYSRRTATDPPAELRMESGA